MAPPKTDLWCSEPRRVNIFWKGGRWSGPLVRLGSCIHRCARVTASKMSMVAESKLVEPWLEEREGNNWGCWELLLSVSASNDSWWLLKRHYGLVLPSRKEADRKTAVEIRRACFRIGWLENNLACTLPGHYQQCPTGIGVEVRPEEWFEGDQLERVLQTLFHAWRVRMQESVKISGWEKDQCMAKAGIAHRAKVTLSKALS